MAQRDKENKTSANNFCWLESLSAALVAYRVTLRREIADKCAQGTAELTQFAGEALDYDHWMGRHTSHCAGCRQRHRQSQVRQ